MKGYRANLPADFARLGAISTNKFLMAHYGVCETTIVKWRKASGAKAPRKVAIHGGTFQPVPIPADFAVNAPLLTKAEAQQHWGRGQKVIDRWYAETGIRPRLFRPSPRLKTVKGGMAMPGLKGSIPPASDGSLAGRAAEHLRRRDAVFRCREDGKADPNGKFWFTCSRVLTSEELIERAKVKGFDADAWMRLAA